MWNLNRTGRRRGFTLIELLVVMGVIAILMTFLVPTLKTVRQKANENRTLAVIQSVSMSCDQYFLTYSCYPPDRVPTPPGLYSTSEAIVYFLSGSSICYAPGVSRADYPWRHAVYQDPTPTGTGRRSLTPFLQFKSQNLMDKDNDLAPELVDAWQMHFVYNSGSDSNFDSPTNPNAWNQLASPKHWKSKFDLFSPGYDGKYGTDDDLTSWGAEAPPPVDYDYASMNTTEP